MSSIDTKVVKLFSEYVIGNEKQISAHTDLETPSKRLLFKISTDKGYDWSEELDDTIGWDFNFINKAVCAASNYVENHYKQYYKDNDKRDPMLETTLLGGFMFGVYEYIRYKINKNNN